MARKILERDRYNARHRLARPHLSGSSCRTDFGNCRHNDSGLPRQLFLFPERTSGAPRAATKTVGTPKRVDRKAARLHSPEYRGPKNKTGPISKKTPRPRQATGKTKIKGGENKVSIPASGAQRPNCSRRPGSQHRLPRESPCSFDSI